MNIPMSWITEYVPLGTYDINDFVSRLTMIGQKVETVEQVSSELDKIVAGKVLEIEKHPNSEKLFVANVDCGAEALTIVTGAQNVKKGDLVPIALPGATLSNGAKIERTQLRGVASDGMMCSVEELGFTRHDFPDAPEHGIYILNAETKAGADICELLELRQEVVEYEITSNRPDCVSVLGIAREAAAAYGVAFNKPDFTVKEAAGGNAADMVSIEIEDETLCPRYIARIIKNVRVGDSPQWLRRRLTSAGVRPINNIVDITNYVMLETGQPMHAFDLSSVTGGIVVRRAKDGEEFTTLDGTVRKLDSSMLMIADHEKSLGIAGVMGGENSKISLSEGGREATGAVLLESANFNGTNIRLTSKKLGLRTDASGRFEKGLDPNLAELAADRAANLIELLGAGEVVKGRADCFPQREKYTKKREIPFEPDKINRLLGTDLAPNEMKKLIEPFEIEIPDGRVAIIPTFRADMEGMADLAEEVARAYGYDKIQPKMLTGAPTVGKKTHEQSISDIIKETFAAMGFFEALTYSFESRAVFEKLLVPEGDPLRSVIPILNPLGEAYSIMRTTPANSMLTSLALNHSRRNPSALLFETANIYIPKSLPLTEQPHEKSVFIAGLYGPNEDFFTAKGCVETLFETLGIKLYDFSPSCNVSWLHPGRRAGIIIGGEQAGYIGEVHPACVENYSLGGRAYMFELSANALYEHAITVRKYAELPKFPAIQRDIALLVSDSIPVKSIRESIIQNGGPLLCEVTLFDVYVGEQVSDSQKSVAYSLVFRSKERTLSDAEVNPLMTEILNGLEKAFGARLRE